MLSSVRPLLVAFGSVASLAMFLGGCSGAEIDPRTLPPVVRVMQVSAADAGSQQFSGVVAARVQSDLGFRVGGKVTARYVNAGETVRRGQALMRIDGSDLSLATQAAQGAVAAAQARATQTAAEEARLRGLVEAGAISASAYDQAKAAAAEARAGLATANAQARVARNEAGYTVLIADVSGTVVETLAEQGQVVAAGQTVVRIAQSGPREALIKLPENVRPELGSIVEVETFGGAIGTGRLRQLADAADPATRTYEARYVLAGEPAEAPLGATITVAISRPGDGVRQAVPLSAIRDAGKGPGVWVVRSGDTKTVVWRPVKIATVDEERALLSSGLKAGDTIVAMGAHLLRQGQPVRIARK